MGSRAHSRQQTARIMAVTQTKDEHSPWALAYRGDVLLS
jgi:hypothetical protein